MKELKTIPWDAADHLESREDMAAYLEAALEEGDPALILVALGDIARSKGMTLIAKETGLGRESLYKALSANGNPEFVTVLKVISSITAVVTPLTSPAEISTSYLASIEPRKLLSYRFCF